MIVIIPCGARKKQGTWPAFQLYTGPYYTMCLRYALSLTSPGNIFILSAKYGLLRLTDLVKSYNLKMGQPGSVKVDEVRRQAQELGLLESSIYAIGGRLYTNICRQVWPSCKTPLDGLSGLGKQLSWMKAHMGKI